jgi:hypothetical protein
LRLPTNFGVVGNCVCCPNIGTLPANNIFYKQTLRMLPAKHERFRWQNHGKSLDQQKKIGLGKVCRFDRHDSWGIGSKHGGSVKQTYCILKQQKWSDCGRLEAKICCSTRTEALNRRTEDLIFQHISTRKLWGTSLDWRPAQMGSPSGVTVEIIFV